MKQILAGLLMILAVASLEFACTRSAHAQTVSNAIKMGYNFTTVSQTVVFNSTMQTGGTMTFSASAMDGGGRAPGDPFTMKLVFYNASNQVITTVQQANTLVYGTATPQNYSVTTSNCGGSCASVAYVSVQFYGKDGGYWAGNYGPYIINPTLTFNGGSNILYNPEFGVYGTNGFAQGWASTAGWQNCALYSGAATCVVNNGAQVNGGTYSATGGTTSGSSGGYVAAPVLAGGASSSAFVNTPANTAKVTSYKNRTTADTQVYVEQIGNSNTITVEQTGTKNNHVDYYSNGNSNNVSIKQSSTNATAVNYAELKIVGNQNTANITQQSTGGEKSAFVSITDNNNSVLLTQKDAGSHYAEVTLTGGNKNVDILQQGSAAHQAKVALSGLATDLSLTQTGSTQQSYSINFNCATAGGCAKITVSQGQ